jgi:ribosomal protein S14
VVVPSCADANRAAHSHRSRGPFSLQVVLGLRLEAPGRSPRALAATSVRSITPVMIEVQPTGTTGLCLRPIRSVPHGDHDLSRCGMDKAERHREFDYYCLIAARCSRSNRQVSFLRQFVLARIETRRPLPARAGERMDRGRARAANQQWKTGCGGILRWHGVRTHRLFRRIALADCGSRWRDIERSPPVLRVAI